MTTTAIKHPAKFTDDILPPAAEMLVACGSTLLDPFAGTGKGVDFLSQFAWDAVGVELEPEWAAQSERVIVGSALHLPFADASFDVIFTSPCYGNRMADRDMRDSVAGTYAKALGRHASEGSACHLQWGPAYRGFHREAWVEADRVLRPGGHFLLNMKDHVRGDQLQHVTAWHTDTLQELGFKWKRSVMVDVPGLRVGANADNRVDWEWLVLLVKP